MVVLVAELKEICEKTLCRIRKKKCGATGKTKDYKELAMSELGYAIHSLDIIATTSMQPTQLKECMAVALEHICKADRALIVLKDTEPPMQIVMMLLLECIMRERNNECYQPEDERHGIFIPFPTSEQFTNWIRELFQI